MTYDRTIVLLPTDYCNFSCKMCGVRKSNKYNYISILKLKNLFEIAKEQHFQKIALTGGGEPSIDFKKLLQIINIANTFHFEISLITNGSFFSKDKNSIEKLKDAGLNEICFSIDNFHLKFIKLEILSNAIKSGLDSGLKVRIRMTTTKETEKKDFAILKKIEKNLKGKLISIYPFEVKNSHVFAIIIERNIIIVYFTKIIKSEMTDGFKNDFKYKNLRRLIFKRCSIGPVNLTINAQGKFMPCCDYNVINNPSLFQIHHIDTLKRGKHLDQFDPIINSIMYDSFGFLKLYFKMMKIEKLRKIILNSKFYSECELCMLAKKYEKNILKIHNISNLEVIYAIIRNFPYFVNDMIERLSIRICYLIENALNLILTR